MTQVGKMTVATPSDREVVVTRVFDAPRRLVFDAHTKPEIVKRWLLGPAGWTMPVCEIDLRAGGKYRYVWAHPDKPGFEIGGVYREIVAPERIVTTEQWMGAVAENTMVLTEKAGKTTMTFTMDFGSKEARDAALATGMTGGMEESYVRLDEIAAESRKSAGAA
jgi:uncharacterized protein YndB with AHSA1/START domain